jgi:thiol:disulfide interchange protein DsbD
MLLASFAPATAANQVSARLVSDHDAISPGTEFRLGVHFEIPEHAHIYWTNPGDSGLPTKVVWSVPDGFSPSELQWPNPVALYDDILEETSFGYEREVVLFVNATAPNSPNTGQSVRFAADVTWLVCLEDGACIPERASLELDLPIADQPKPSRHAALFDAFAGQVPHDPADSPAPVRVSIAGPPAPEVRAELDPPWRFDAVAAEFFPDRGGPWRLVDPAAANGPTRRVAFGPGAPIDQPISGALTLKVANDETRRTDTLYLRLGPQPKGD